MCKFITVLKHYARKHIGIQEVKLHVFLTFAVADQLEGAATAHSLLDQR
jgi:hypothetical protein